RPVDGVYESDQLHRLDVCQVVERTEQLAQHNTMRSAERSFALFAVKLFPRAKQPSFIAEFFFCLCSAMFHCLLSLTKRLCLSRPHVSSWWSASSIPVAVATMAPA